MDVVYSQCCGLGVHKRTVVASVMRTAADGQVRKESRSFGTTTDEILRMRDWVRAAGSTHVAMESTGVYWKPIYNLLEGQFELLVVSAQLIVYHWLTRYTSYDDLGGNYTMYGNAKSSNGDSSVAWRSWATRSP
jgi:hypothetical protein